MSKNQNSADADMQTQNQNNAMSDDPGDGKRNSFTARPEGKTQAEKALEQDQQNQATVEALGRAGLGVAAKE